MTKTSSHIFFFFASVLIVVPWTLNRFSTIPALLSSSKSPSKQSRDWYWSVSMHWNKVHLSSLVFEASYHKFTWTIFWANRHWKIGHIFLSFSEQEYFIALSQRSSTQLHHFIGSTINLAFASSTSKEAKKSLTITISITSISSKRCSRLSREPG